MKVLIQFLLILIIIQSHVSKSPNFFRSSKISLEVSDIIKEQSTQDKLSEDTSNDCLVSESEAYKILKETKRFGGVGKNAEICFLINPARRATARRAQNREYETLYRTIARCPADGHSGHHDGAREKEQTE